MRRCGLLVSETFSPEKLGFVCGEAFGREVPGEMNVSHRPSPLNFVPRCRMMNWLLPIDAKSFFSLVLSFQWFW